jgi:hypothetical protein
MGVARLWSPLCIFISDPFIRCKPIAQPTGWRAVSLVAVGGCYRRFALEGFYMSHAECSFGVLWVFHKGRTAWHGFSASACPRASAEHYA